MTDREALLELLLREAVTVPEGDYPSGAWFARWWDAWRRRVCEVVHIEWEE